MTTPAPTGRQLTCQGTGEPFVHAGTRAGRWVLATSVLGSGMAILDGTVVNVALRTLGQDLGASVPEVQWVVNAYLLALASLILTAGALGDRLGRRRIYLVGVAWFGTASILCALARSPEQLIVARGVQGVGAALLAPGSLAIIQGSFRPADRGRMIGQWAGLGSIAAAIGPPLGGWILDVASWRWIFWINVPICLLIILIGRRHVPESRDPETTGGHDVAGSALAVLGLGAVTYALIEGGSRLALAAGVVGLAALVLFLVVEHRRAHPMLPLGLFRSRVFSVANGMTLLVYGALGVMLFFVVLQLQVVVGYSPLQAGLATLPITAVLLSLSSRSGRARRPDRTAPPALRRPHGRGRRRVVVVARRRGERLRHRDLPGHRDLRPRHGEPGRAADHERAGGSSGPVCRRGERSQQRSGTNRVAARGGCAARSGRPRGRRLPAP